MTIAALQEALIPLVQIQEKQWRRVRTDADVASAQQSDFDVFDGTLPLFNDRTSYAPDCSKGCHHCCYWRVETSTAEVFLLYDYLQANNNKSQLDAVLARLADNSATIRDMSADEHRKTNIRCALLTDAGECSAYSARPFACRRHFSLDRSICKRAFEDPEDDSPQQLNGGALMFWQALDQVATDALTASGRRPQRVELHTALLELFQSATARKRWRKGKKAFLHAQPAD